MFKKLLGIDDLRNAVNTLWDNLGTQVSENKAIREDYKILSKEFCNLDVRLREITTKMHILEKSIETKIKVKPGRPKSL